MVTSSRLFGQGSETLAINFLKKNGYHILEQNYRTFLGEIDIIARDKETIAFIEVKSRSSFTLGNPRHAVTLQKQKKISKTALHYLKQTRQSNVKARFDVVTILMNSGINNIELIKNAFELYHYR